MQLLASDLFCVTHDSLSMRPRLAQRITGTGLAAALLGEQLLFRTITAHAGRIRIVTDKPPHDWLAHKVLGQLLAEPEITSIRDWLRVLSFDAYALIEQRLVGEGKLRAREVKRFLRGSTTVYEPATMTDIGYPESRLAKRLGQQLDLEPPDQLLAGLVKATGLDTYVLADQSARWKANASVYTARVINNLPPSLKVLVQETAAAVGDAVLSAR